MNPRAPHLLAPATAAVFLSALALASCAPASSASPSIPTPLETVIIDKDSVPVPITQRDLLAVAEPLTALVDPTEGRRNETADGETYGYAGVAIDIPNSTVDVYWVGEVEKKAQKILDGAPAGVIVDVHPAVYTQFEMRDAREAVSDAAFETELVEGLRIDLIGPSIDGSGLDVEYYGSGDVDALLEKVSDIAGMPVNAREGAPIEAL